MRFLRDKRNENNDVGGQNSVNEKTDTICKIK